MTPHASLRTFGVLTILFGLIAILPASASAAPLTVGVQSDNMLLGDPATREAELDRIAGTGATVVRVTLGWRFVASNAGACKTASLAELYSQYSACYNWGMYDHLVSEARKRRLLIVFSVFQVPDWVLGKGWAFVGGPERTFRRVVVPKWAAFAQAAATRYNARSPYGHVRRWTVGNEPNSAYFWQPMNRNAPKRYATLFRAVAPAIRAGNRRAIIAAGPTGPRSTMKPTRWLSIALPAMQRNGSGRWLSAWAHNSYPRGARSPRVLKTNAPSIDVTNMQTLYSMLDRYRATRKKKVWVLEFAYQTNPPDRIFGVSWRNQATYLAEGFDMHNDGRTQMVVWYVLRDPGDPVDWQSGLWDVRGRSKPALAMFQRPVAMNTTRIRRGQTVQLFGMSLLRPGRQTLKYSYTGRRWKTVPRQKRSGATVRATFRPKRSVRVRVVDPRGAGPYRVVRVR